MKEQYKKGDKVVIQQPKTEEDRLRAHWVPDMDDTVGDAGTITAEHNTDVGIVYSVLTESGDCWSYSPQMLRSATPFRVKQGRKRRAQAIMDKLEF